MFFFHPFFQLQNQANICSTNMLYTMQYGIKEIQVEEKNKVYPTVIYQKCLIQAGLGIVKKNYLPAVPYSITPFSLSNLSVNLGQHDKLVSIYHNITKCIISTL